MNLENDEMIIWDSPSQMIIGGAVVVGALIITNRRIVFYQKDRKRFLASEGEIRDIWELGINRVREEGLDKKVAILAGVMPVKSERALVYMEDQVPGMTVPRDLILRMRDAVDPKEEGVKIAVETILQLKEFRGLRGIHLMPLLWESITPQIAEESGLLQNNLTSGRNTK